MLRPADQPRVWVVSPIDLLPATVALLLPLDVRQAVALPTAGHALVAMANAAVLIVLMLLLRGWLPGRSRKPGASHT